MKKAFFLLYALLSLPAAASPAQSHAAIRDTALAFARAQTQGLPGKVSIQVDDIDKRIVLPACPALEAFLPAGAQLNGNSSVGVRCTAAKGWSVFVPVTVKVSVNLLIAHNTLQLGQVVRAEDLGSLSSETLQPGSLTDAAQAIGKVMKFGVGRGQLLRKDMLRDPYSVTQGQNVQLQINGQGFRIQSEGKSLSNAAEGQTATARTSTGQTVSGIVRNGTIEIKQ
jgi:flagellar basal body P-ring formation protein FlgA